MPGRRIVILWNASKPGTLEPCTLCVEKGFGACFCAAMAKAGIALAEAHDDGINECFNILGYESVPQVQDACKEWQLRPQSEVSLGGGRPN